MTDRWVVTRRDFLQIAALTAIAPRFLRASEGSPRISFGLVTDSHYADADRRGSRYYRQSLGKMAECVQFMNEKKVDFLVELGDFKDQDEDSHEQHTLRYLTAIEEVYSRFQGPRYHVVGNHDLDSISKEQFLGAVDNTGIPNGRSYYSFDRGAIHFVVLDASFRSDSQPYDHGNFFWWDANIPPSELEWLQGDLAKSANPAIVMTHQLLDDTPRASARNAEQVREILESSGKVLAVFQGHYHKGGYGNIKDIHYFTLKAMVEGSGAENNSYAIVDVFDRGLIQITGYRNAVSMDLTTTP
jgi:alkaline phosphatase